MPSIVLFVDGFPTSFSVSKKEDLFLLQPLENPYNSIPPKKIEVRLVDGKWEVKGTDDQSLIDQVLEDIVLLHEKMK